MRLTKRLRPASADLIRGAGFYSSLWQHLRQPVTLEEAGATLSRRLEQRQAGLLAVARRAIYAHAPSPYLRLLRSAGCEYGDLERLVREKGVDGALTVLLRRGVYLSVNELKGERPVVRGSLRFSVNPRDIRSPCWLVPSPITTTTARRRGRVPIYLAMFQDLAVTASLSLSSRDGLCWSHARWGEIGVSAILWLLRYWGPTHRPSRWFSKTPLGLGLSTLQRWTVRMMYLACALAGQPVPRVEYVPLDDPRPILRWMQRELLAGRTPHLFSMVSPAVTAAQVALEMGIDLQGAQFSISAEPVTASRLAAIQQTGATALPSYGAKETGLLAHGCLDPTRPDDMHLYHDLYAVIRPNVDGASQSLPRDALLFSSLRLGWPLVTLNLSIGDRGELEHRQCGCPLERLGWTTHVHGVRGFDKLKIGGTIIPASGIVELLERELPSRFGGGPIDYQLVEDAGATIDGHPRLRLLIHPAVGPLNTDLVAELFLDSVRAMDARLDRLWTEKRWLRVERQPPLETLGGKVYHIHSSSLSVET
jgi:hypothetical protein